MKREVIDALNAVLDFRYDENAPHALVRGNFNSAEQEAAIVDGFMMLVDPVFAQKLHDLSVAMEKAGMEKTAFYYIPLRAHNLGGLSLCGLEDGFTELSSRIGSRKEYYGIVEKAEEKGLVVSDIAEVQVTSRDILLQVMGNEEGMCEAAFTRDKFLQIASAPFERQKDSPKP